MDWLFSCAISELALLDHCNITSYINDLSFPNLETLGECLSDTHTITVRVRGACDENSPYYHLCVPLHARSKCKAPWMIRNSIYYYQLLPWLEEFNENQLLLIKSEDFFTDTAAVMDRATKFLELDPINWTDIVKSTFNIIADIHEPAHLNMDNTGISAYPSICPETKLILSKYFETFNARLKNLVSINWDDSLSYK